MEKAKKLVAKAERTNKERDEMEREAGLGTPTSGDDAALLRTAMCALVAGMEMSDLDCVAEGYVMLRQLHQRAYGMDYNPL
jgi:hypothetical protein